MNPVKTPSVKTTSAITDNDEILARRVAFRTERSAEGPQVGDFIITDDGTPGGTEPRGAHPRRSAGTTGTALRSNAAAQAREAFGCHYRVDVDRAEILARHFPSLS